MVPLAAILPPAALPTNGVPTALLARLGRGANVTRWFCYQPNYEDPARMRDYLLPGDMANFKRLGITWIRLCVSPEAAYSSSTARDGRPNPKVTPYLDAAIAKLSRAGRATVLDLHDNGQLKLDEAGRDPKDLLTFWRGTARRLKGKGYDRLLFEIVNEPVFEKNPEDWFKMQERAVAAIRKEDPKRTIVVTSNRWSGPAALQEMKPLRARNLVYTFHFYDPFWFTHQGATWAGEGPKLFKGIPFPSSPEAVAPIVAALPAPYDGYIRDYGAKRYDAAFLRRSLVEAADWGRRNGVPVTLGEFGAYPPVSPPDSRERYFRGMREAIAAARLPAAIWGYDDALGLGRGVAADGTITLDPMVERVFFGGG